jgi:hypothetical protein
MSNKVMIAVNELTKTEFHNLPFPDYIKTNEARIRYIIAKFHHIKE